MGRGTTNGAGSAGLANLLLNEDAQHPAIRTERNIPKRNQADACLGSYAMCAHMHACAHIVCERRWVCPWQVQVGCTWAAVLGMRL